MANWNLPPLREGHPADADLVERRVRTAGVLTGEENIVDTVIGGIRCLVVNDAGTGPTLLYFHGGGYRLGSPVMYIGLAQKIADLCDARVVMPFYRLAPENPYPAAIHDAVAVFRALSGTILVGGDSAGGGLAAALCLVAHQADTSPAGAVLLSPVLDMFGRDATYKSNAGNDPYWSRQSLTDCGALYLQGEPFENPLVSPIEADPAAFPATLILAGGHETLLGEALTFATNLALANGRVTLHCAPDMGHVWPVLAPQAPESDEAVAAIAAFIKARG